MKNAAFWVLPAAALALSACTTRVPDSAAGMVDPGEGVGFGSYADYAAAREAQLGGGLQPPTDIESAVLDAQGGASAARNSGDAPLQASPSNPPPQVVTNSSGISDEQDFDAVAEERDIEADADLIAQNRARYRVIEPTALPTREGTDQPNIVQYALDTDNPVGTQLYRRLSLMTAARHQRNCAAFATPDAAQEAFLVAGGPERDREGLDPDGDGFACDWDPAPFRALRGG